MGCQFRGQGVHQGEGNRIFARQVNVTAHLQLTILPEQLRDGRPHINPNPR